METVTYLCCTRLFSLLRDTSFLYHPTSSGETYAYLTASRFDTVAVGFLLPHRTLVKRKFLSFQHIAIHTSTLTRP